MMTMKRRFLLYFLLVLWIPCLSAQEVYYYGANNRPVKNVEEAILFKTVHQKSKKKYIISSQVRTDEGWRMIRRQKIRINRDGMLRIAIKEDKLIPKIIFREIRSMVPDPDLYVFEETRRGGAVVREGKSSTFLPLHLEGKVTEFYPDGQTKSISYFNNNQLISNENWLTDGSKYIDSIFYSVNEEPVFTLGEDFFKTSILDYLSESDIILDEFEDEVLIGWVVMETGEMDGVIALEGKSDKLNQVLVDAVSQVPGRWQPAILAGDTVRYFMTMPLTISHNDANFQNLEFKWGVLHYDYY